MTKKCIVFCAQPISAAMLRHVAPGACLIAADAGYGRATALGLRPHIVLGDFDSGPRPAPSWPCELVVLPSEKDDTDSHYAVCLALERGYRDIVLLGATGGRPDHSFANLQTMLHAARQGARVMAAFEGGEWYCIGPGSLSLRKKSAWVSVFATGGEAKGVYLKGLKYTLDNAILTQEYPIGVSNEFMADEAIISCDKGYLYVMITDYSCEHTEAIL